MKEVKKTPKTQSKNTNQSQHNRFKIKNDDTLVYALGGLGEVGKNMYCIEQGNEILIVDCGVRFPDEELLGVDAVIPEMTHLIENNKKKKVLVITHGHEDHIGGIPYLLQSVQIDAIYAPQFASALIQKKLDERKIRGTKIRQINCDSKVKMKNFTCGFFDTTHSIPDSLGIIINTPNGRIVHTGDFKFDLTPVGTNSEYQKMAYIGQIGVDLLLSDSTNSGVEGFSISEKKVASSILDVFKKTDGRIIVATFASNVYRLAQILDAAVKCGRKVAVFGRSMENVLEVGRKQGKIKIKDSNLLTPDQLNSYPPEKTCIVCTGSQGEPLAALSRIAAGTHRQIKLRPNDTIVFSSSPIPGNSNSVNQVINKLYRHGANVLTNSILNNLHTTGHASQDEQKLMLQLMKPKYFMPIHGEYKMLKQHAASGEETGVAKDHIFTLANGDCLIMRKGKVFLSPERFQADDIYVDGNDISGISTAVLKDRKVLADNGLVSVIIPIDSRKSQVLSKPVIVTRGFVFIKDSQSLIKEAEQVVFDALKEKMQTKITFGAIKNTVRGTLEPFLYKKTHRNPIVIPVILNSKEAIEEMQSKHTKVKAKPKPKKKTTKKPEVNA
ncbi:ribonuclease J [Breznakia sp. PF5-3]|uniref:ribonuclease J1 n=1 Tax=unclassified Breznakia TaxID=2623764 RepID=UPI002405903B|nr:MULTISPECIES: ribonuclease J [unclassified Breznakia]MDF9823696.1 ribonuclease J [Breznakia sp. PM6-1]MDF9834494.1 ribonuclease J [Breznakia sp. PF5-3]MDF9837535.1 ribonuclease J [Breznakia sp. PFB2-8]MDF9859112.1 ribonuclease J [Breznakia sp. PH5-24]